MEKSGDVLVFFLNGEKVEVERPDPAQSLADYLRGEGFTGTKVGCGRGLCGACTVMLSTHDPLTKQVTHRSINACLAPLCSIDHAAVTTIEGLGNTRAPGAAHPIQERFTLAHASQCGFCTPGMVMAFYALLRSHPDGLTEEDVKANIDGNLCRCTGYRPILDAMRTFAKNTECAKQEVTKDENGYVVTHSLGLDGATYHPLNLTSEPIFPPFLMTHPPRSAHYVGDTIDWYKPTTLKEALALKAKHPEAQILAGNTRLVNKKLQPTVVISVGLIPELKTVAFTDAGLDVGAAVTLTTLRDSLVAAVATQDEGKTAGFAALAEQVKWIGGTQVRNSATVGGSLVAGHIWGGQEASDLIPVLVVLGATVTIVAGSGDRRSVPVSAFVKGGGKVDLQPDELILSIQIPHSQPGEHVESYKQSGRQTSSASLVTGGCRLHLEESDGDWVIKSATICLGGVSPKPGQSAAKTEAYLAGKSLRGLHSDLQTVFGLLAEDYPVEGEGAEYKRAVISGIFFKFYSRVVAHVSSEEDLFAPYQSRVTRGQQRFAEPESFKVVAHPTKHTTSHIQSSGEALFADDMQARRMLYATMVLATKAHARVVSIDASPALALPGVRAFYSAKDVPVNVGELFKDGVLFAADEVQYYGQPLGIVVADTQERASRAARLVKVEYEDLPAIITIEDGIKAGSFFETSPMFHDHVERGNVEEALKQADTVVEGEFNLGGALHWYMEPHSCLVEPKDDGGLLIHCTAQGVALVQEEVAFALNMHQKDVDVRVKRVGGGFGGKATRFFMYSAAALAAKLLNRPVKHTLDRGTDSQAAGTRAPYHFKYKVGATSAGKIIAADFQVYANGGAAIDLSYSILAETINHLDNCYNVPHFRAVGKVIRSNIAPTKPYRGAGIPQGIVAGEFSLDHVARKLGLAPHIVRELNFYQQGEVTLAGQHLDECSLGAVWHACRQQSDFDRRFKEAHAFNQHSTYTKRGVATMPIKQGVGIGGAMAVWAKACALVHILSDGTVIVNHGGVEMGQGLNIKIAQLAAETLGVPLETVHVPPTSNEVLQHGGATGGSFTFELNGSAVRKACEELNARLAPLKEAMAGKAWKEVVQAALFSRVCLSSYGWHAVDFEDRKFLYYAWGTAFAEVELDVLTGSYRVLRVDVVQDVGTSINPAVDVGQVEGAFVQGVGWLTSEELKWDAQGRVDHNYEIPTPESIPIEFHVNLLKGPNARGLLSSKGIGEPPKSLSATVALAIKDAIVAARAQAGLSSDDLVLDLPLTVERVRLACGDLGLEHTLETTTTK